MKNENSEKIDSRQGTGLTTEDELDSGLKAFFAGRIPPPAGVKTAIAGKLSTVKNDVERRKAVGKCFMILAYAAFFSISLLGVVWTLLGVGIIFLVVSFYLFATLVCGLALTLALRILTKGGNGYAVLLD